MKAQLKGYVKKFFYIIGIDIRKLLHSDSSPYALGYVNAKETIDLAAKSGLSVSDYLDKLWNQQGNRDIIIDELKKLGILNENAKNICEIGTGAGLYAEKTIEFCQPICYESYETDKDWAEWLEKKYKIISHNADGKSLCYTQTNSIDLVLAHGVFVYLPFLITYRYFEEIFRVTKNKGYVIFDILSEECFDDETAQKWLESEQMYPCFLGRQFVIELFDKKAFSLVGEFINYKFGVGISKYLIFQKKSSVT